MSVVVAAVVYSGASLEVRAEVVSSAHHDIRVETVAKGFEHPWGLAFLPDGQLLVTERGGRLYRVDPDDGRREGISGVPDVVAQGQGGLLDVALHPRFAENRLIYLSYAERREGGALTSIGRGRLDDDGLVDFEVIYRAEPALGGGRHFGSRMVFDADGYLFVTTGDRGERHNAQRLDRAQGKVIRLHDDGAVPEDNPFVNEADADPAIYSLGHRNAQGLIRHPERDEIWLNEHGPRGGDEINIVHAGENYGWPEVTLGREYYGPPIGAESKPGMVDPIHHWTPSIAPSGFAYYDGDEFPRWRGNLLVGALAHTHLARLELDGERILSEERLLDEQGWRVRAVASDAHGRIYLLVDDSNAPLVRLVNAEP